MPPDLTRLVFDGALGIRNIGAIHARLLQALAEQPALWIDCRAAESVDLSFVQLLLAARLCARRDGKTLQLAAPAGGALRTALARAGLWPANAAEPGDPFWVGAP